jgi:hypothetical protein
MPRGQRTSDYDFNVPEDARLTSYLQENNPGIAWRHRYDEDRDAYIYEHRQAQCALWRRGVGILVHRPGFQPAQRLAGEGR